MLSRLAPPDARSASTPRMPTGRPSMVPLSLLLGNVWPLLSPMRTVHLAISRLLRSPPDQGVAPLRRPPAASREPRRGSTGRRRRRGRCRRRAPRRRPTRATNRPGAARVRRLGAGGAVNQWLAHGRTPPTRSWPTLRRGSDSSRQWRDLPRRRSADHQDQVAAVDRLGAGDGEPLDGAGDGGGDGGLHLHRLDGGDGVAGVDRCRPRRRRR